MPHCHAQGLTQGGKRKSQIFIRVSRYIVILMSCFPLIAFSSMTLFLDLPIIIG